jgi:hypothetical protein
MRTSKPILGEVIGGEMDPALKAVVEEARKKAPPQLKYPELYTPLTLDEKDRRKIAFQAALGSITNEEADAIRKSIAEGRDTEIWG